MEADALFAILDGDASYKAAVGTDGDGTIKVYPSTAEQAVARPYAVYNVISSNELYSKDGRGGTVPRVQLDHYGNTAEQAQNLEELAIAALDGFRGVIAGVNVNSIRVLNRNTGFADQVKSKRRSTDFSIRINL